ncbi:glycosyltransferase [bacterium]|nr:glycosyltransferase [bacterium]
MSVNPLISVIIPMYNAEKFIEKCLEHLIHQTYHHLEIIIVDDGSQDNSVRICQKYAKEDPRIRIIQQKNGGPSVASNAGLDAAQGEYIHFHDHDDFVNLDYFERMSAAIALTEADILCGEVNQVAYNFPVFNQIEILTTLTDKVIKTRANRFNPAWRYVYKKSFLKSAGLRFEPQAFGTQDLFFTKPAIILAKTVATVPGARYNVVDTPTALGKVKARRRMPSPEMDKVWQKYYSFLHQHKAYDIINWPEEPDQIETLKIFNCPIWRRDIFPHKVRYYLFGINIGTKHMKP